MKSLAFPRGAMENSGAKHGLYLREYLEKQT